MAGLDQLETLLFDRKGLAVQVHSWQQEGLKVAFTNGVFDLLHLGHADYLANTRALADKLVVGVNSDASARRLGKGAGRPIQDGRSRALLLAALSSVDAVCLFDEDTPYELIAAVKPDVLAKGGDYKLKQIAGHDLVMARGGVVKVIPFLPGYSTTAIERKIRETQ